MQCQTWFAKGRSFWQTFSNIGRFIYCSLTLSQPKMQIDTYILLCLTPDHFTLSNARRLYSSMREPSAVKGLK